MARGKTLTLWVTALAAMTVAAGCGEDSDETGTTGTGTTGTEAETTPASTGPPTATVKATLGEFFIRTDHKAVDAGTIKFEVANEGKIEHEFEVVRTDEAPGAFPVTDENKADVEAVGEEVAEIPPIASGASEELTLDLEPGKLVFICNLPSHYKSGQRLGFTVR